MNGYGYATTYDAWNRVATVSGGGSAVAAYAYDGMGRRTLKRKYAGGTLDETRHLYYSPAWQALEERVGTGTAAERQFVWGLGYVDTLLLRDRDTNGDGTLDERLYALQNQNWNVTALADTAGSVQERYAYDAYGLPTVLTPGFVTRAASAYDWESAYAGYRWDGDTELYCIRYRFYHPRLGCFVSRDPAGYGAEEANLYRYVRNQVTRATDPDGRGFFVILGLIAVGAGGLAYGYFAGGSEGNALAIAGGVVRNPVGRTHPLLQVGQGLLAATILCGVGLRALVDTLNQGEGGGGGGGPPPPPPPPVQAGCRQQHPTWPPCPNGYTSDPRVAAQRAPSRSGWSGPFTSQRCDNAGAVRAREGRCRAGGFRWYCEWIFFIRQTIRNPTTVDYDHYSINCCRCCDPITDASTFDCHFVHPSSGFGANGEPRTPKPRWLP